MLILSSTAIPPDMPTLGICKLELFPKHFLYMLIFVSFFTFKCNNCYTIVNTISADISWMQEYRQMNFWYAFLSFVSFQLCYYLRAKIMAYLGVLLYILVLVNVVCPKVSNNSYSNWCFLVRKWCYFILRNY